MSRFAIFLGSVGAKYAFLTLALGVQGFAPNAHAADLVSLYRMAKNQDPQLAAAEAAYEAAQQRWPQARAAFLPQIEANASYGRNHQNITESNLRTAYPLASSSFNSNAYGIEISQTLFDYSAFMNLNRVEAQLASAGFDYEAARQDLIWRLSSAYFDVLAARDAVNLSTVELNALEEQLDATRMRLKYGFSPITAVKETEARYDLAQAQRLTAEHELRNARRRIREIVGRLPGKLEPIVQTISFEPPDPESPEAWTQLANGRNPRLASVRAMARAARIEVKRRRGEGYPTVSVAGRYNFQDTTDYAFGREEETGVVVAELRLPLFHGGRADARVQEAGYLHEQRLANVEQTQREIARLTHEGYAGVFTEYRRVEAFRRAVASNRVALDASEQGLAQGQRTNLDVLNARRDLFEARRNLSQARYDFLRERLRLRLAAGQLSLNSVQRLNRLFGKRSIPVSVDAPQLELEPALPLAPATIFDSLQGA